MESNLRKWRNKRDFLKLLQYRENNAEASKFLKQHSQFTDTLIKRLGLEYELEGHQGCVNCLEWTSDGKHLASGSDDTNIILWDPFRHKKLQVIPTHHIGNIFSVKFIGNSQNEIATASGDCRVLVHSISSAVEKAPPLLDCSCHVNRVKRLATSPLEPTIFWSAAEDGLVIQYDVRESHECSLNNKKVLIDLSYNFGEVKCISVNPTKPYYIAVGANDCYIRLYDRRMLKTSTVVVGHTVERAYPYAPHFESTPREETSENRIDPNCVQYYSPGHLAVENAKRTSFKLATTNISFNSSGSEMLVNMGGEQIYLFDVNKSRHIDEIRVPRVTAKKASLSTCDNCRKGEGNGQVNVRYNLSSDDNCSCFYLQRAQECLNRKWMGDVYNATRDYLHVIQNWPDNIQAYVGLIESLIDLNWTKEASEWLDYFCNLQINNNNHCKIDLLRKKIESINISMDNDKSKAENGDEKERFLRKVDETEQRKRLESKDFETRFLGHCNTTTDIKEANFLGEDGNYICAGSDEGIIFVWERKRSKIVTALFGDVSIVNCVQPHPSACFIASSGIDSGVKLWSPLPEDNSINPRMVVDIAEVVRANQERMSMDPFESMLVNMGYRIPGINVQPVSENENGQWRYAIGTGILGHPGYPFDINHINFN